MDLSVSFFHRDFSPPPPGALAGCRVERLTWADPGGPSRASISAPMPPGWQLSELLSLLRRPLVVYTAGGPCWWGYVHAASLSSGGVLLGWDLEKMANRVQVEYRPLHPQAGWASAASRTEWAEEGASVICYGRKEHVLKLENATPAEAESARARYLWQHARPEPVTRRTGGSKGPAQIVIEARGWWDTLSWVHYAQPEGETGYTGSATTSLHVGAVTPASEYLQAFTIEQGWSAHHVWLQAGREGTLADNLQVDLVRIENNQVTHTLASAQVQGSALPPGRLWLQLAFDSPPALAPYVRYGLRVRRTGTASAACPTLGAVTRSGTLEHPLRQWDGSAWQVCVQADTLLWRVSGQVDAMTQAAKLLGPLEGGQFLRGARLPGATVPVPLYCSGQRTALRELMELLSAGDGQGGALSARVTHERWLWVQPREMAEGGARPTVINGGCLLDEQGRSWPLDRHPAGRWVLAGERAVWVSGAEWTPEACVVARW